MAKTKTKALAKRRAAKPVAKPKTTALAKRRPEVLPAAAPLPAGAVEVRTLTEDIQIGALGLVEIKLTEQEERVLARPVNIDDVRVKPSGQAYLSHPTYTRWFNEAFGRTGWCIVPLAKPARSDKGITCPFMLYIHGQPAAYAVGEQDYYESNREQSFGDALEATVASALRRCAKRLGIGLELWDKPWLDNYMAEHAVRVAVRSRGEVKDLWRRRTDRPLAGELGSATPEGGDEARVFRAGGSSGGKAQRQREAVERTPYVHQGDTSVITKQQQDRLFTIVANSGRLDTVVAKWLRDVYGYESSAKIQRQHYEEIVSAIKAEGPL